MKSTPPSRVHARTTKRELLPKAQSQQQIIPSLLETTRSLQSTLSVINVTMVPKSFFDHFSMSMKYISNIRSRLKKHSEYMKSSRCSPKEIFVNSQNPDQPFVNPFHYVELLSVFRIKDIKQDTPFLYGTTNENDIAFGLSAPELATLVGSSSSNKYPQGTSNQKNIILNSTEKLHLLQREIEIQMDEFDLVNDEDEEEDHEAINIFKEERETLFSTVIEDERHKPQLENFFNEQEKVVDKWIEPVTIRDCSDKKNELTIEDPLTDEQRQLFMKQLQDKNYILKKQTEIQKESLKRQVIAQNILKETLSKIK